MPFTIERNDLSTVAADAIVVAANERLQITGGVGLTVAMAAGFDELQAACNEVGFCPCGSAVATPAFGLRAKMVVHAVGPVWQGGGLGEADFLRSAYDAALECALAHGARTIALPLLSAGTYGFPADVSLAVARESIRAFLNRRDDVEVRLVLYSRESVTAGMAAYLDIVEYVDDHYVDERSPWTSAILNAPDWFEERRLVEADTAPSPREQPPRQAAAAAPMLESAPRRPGAGLLGRLGSALAGKRRKREEDVADDLAPEAASAAPSPADRVAGSAGAAPSLASEPARPLDSFTAALEPQSMPLQASAPAPTSAQMQVLVGAEDGAKLAELLDALDAPFSTTLLAIIDERGMTDAQVYKRANMSRQLFSKIRSDANYRPTKKTALALAVALGLNLTETDDLLARAGFALSSSSKADVIVEYFIARGNHDIFEINEALYAFDQPLL